MKVTAGEKPVPMGKYHSTHPHHKDRRIIGYIYKDTWPELSALPDDPLYTAAPLSLEKVAIAIYTYGGAPCFSIDDWNNDDEEHREAFRKQAKFILDSVGAKYE